MKKRGFTLIELLGVIIIIAIILLITVSSAVNIIYMSRKKAALNASYVLIDEVNSKIVEEDFEYNYNEENGYFHYPEDEFFDVFKLPLEIKGKTASSAIAKVNDSKVTEAMMCIDNFIISYLNGKSEVLSGNCDSRIMDGTMPFLTLSPIKVTTRKVDITIRVADEESGIKDIKCEWGTTKQLGTEVPVTEDNHCIIDDLDIGTNVFYKITVKNNVGFEVSDSGKVKTIDFGAILLNFSNTDWDSSKTITVDKEPGHEDETVQYKLEVESDSSKNKGWTTLGDDEEILLDSAANITKPTYLTFRLTDGRHTSDELAHTETKIDITQPNLTVNDPVVTTKSATLTFSASDDESDIDTVTCVYGTTTAYGIDGTITDNHCELKNLTSNSNQTYYYKIEAKNKAGLKKTVTGSTKPNDLSTPSIAVNTANWAKSKTVTITGTTAGAQLQYKLDVTSDSTKSKDWTNIGSGGTITLDSKATTSEPIYVSARLYDGYNSKEATAHTETKIDITKPTVYAYAGSMLYRDPTFGSGTNSTNVYNNSGGGTVTVTRKSMTTPEGNYALEIKTNGTASPGLGGFYFATKTAANKEFITRIVAKIPKGHNINWASNAYGTGGSATWLTSQAGTGDWQEYIVRVKCGASGSFSSTNFYYLSGTGPVTWYVAYATVIDTTLNGNPNYVITAGLDNDSLVNGYVVNQNSSSASFTSVTAKTSIVKISSISANGTYYAWVRDAAGNKNKATLSVSTVNAICPTTSATTVNYDGAAHAIGIRGGSGGTIQYSTNNSSWSSTNPTRTAAGSQTTYVRVAGDSTHNTVNCTARAITINKVNATCPTTSATTVKYDGAAHYIGISGGSGGTPQYSSNNSTWQNSNIGRTAVGSQTTYVRVAGDANHNTVNCTARAITINQRSLSISYRVHYQGGSWSGAVSNGTLAGTTGQSKAIDQFQITSISTDGLTGKVHFQLHQADVGDVTTDNIGSTGHAIQAIRFYMDGQLGSLYEVDYSPCGENYGCLDWASQSTGGTWGPWIGSKGYNLRLEAIKLKLVPKGTNTNKKATFGQSTGGGYTILTIAGRNYNLTYNPSTPAIYYGLWHAGSWYGPIVVSEFNWSTIYNTSGDYSSTSNPWCSFTRNGKAYSVNGPHPAMGTGPSYNRSGKTVTTGEANSSTCVTAGNALLAAYGL